MCVKKRKRARERDGIGGLGEPLAVWRFGGAEG